MRIFSSCFVAVLLGAASASASANYPGVVKSDLGLSSMPGCELCHFNGQTGMGTVTTPVGKSLKARGMTVGNASSLSTALARLTSDKTDSDGDGVGDVDELKAGTDPNVANAAADGGPTPPPTGGLASPTYGCAATPGELPFGTLLALAWLAWRQGLRRVRE